MKTCPNCHAMYQEEEVRFCANCGTPVVEEEPLKPVEEPIPAAPVEEPIPAAPAEEAIPAAPAEEPTPAAPVEEAVPEAPAEEPTPEAPVEEPAPAAPVENPTPAAPTAQPMPEAQSYYQQTYQQVPPQYNYQQSYQQPQQPYQQQPYQQPYQPPYQPQPQPSPTDHTAEFSADEVAKYKLYAASCYLLGVFGVALCALVDKDSKYMQFHMKENMKLFIAETVLVLLFCILLFTIIVPIVAGLALTVLAVLQIYAFVMTLKGKSKEVPILSRFNSLK